MSSEPASVEEHTDDGVLVPLTRLHSADSPRLDGVDEAHARLLAESAAAFPPILVQRGSMRVIDGMHRLRAAQLRRRTQIEVRFVDADDDAAFLRGVAENIEHGLPLSLADRKAAAARIVEMHPEWSNRAVAMAAGLSDKTVAVIRGAVRNGHTSRRKGRDGRLRPVSGTEGRLRASELLAERPDASLRKVAATAGISPATARDVRDRMRRGKRPTTTTRPTANAASGSFHPRKALASVPVVEAPDLSVILSDLRRDPALRYTDAGRALLRWLNAHPAIDQTSAFIDALPPHCLPAVGRLIRCLASYWADFADSVENRARRETA